ncbi:MULTISPECIES: hypothetical protein [Halocynthiibacter]|uniref:Aldose 1-epimerase n=1 Tax=Halocynthiibacter halioticoli TaxID=2986804 RepID=A0AAE3IYW3_9RHOB|nr:MULTISPECIES: hypothetical protein [Halocynthiibacter]MCV6823463.1 hypothetical protein [Halocynthiibacter halioticoli]MCW4056464.1 hypothetical protein [Halocynthiibacter sp. SDUM655004]
MVNSRAQSWSFEWDHGRGEVAALGGMLGPVKFSLADGRIVQPFAIAPWGDEPDAPADMPGILRRLRGEWPCVPFGMTTPPDNLVNGWEPAADINAEFHKDPHGVSSNVDWSLRKHFGTGAEIEVSYPSDHPVEKLVRRIEGRKGEAAVDITLEIHMRKEASLPIGLHPVFALPQMPGAARLEIPSAKSGHIYPTEVEPNVSKLLPGGVSTDLTAMPAADGGAIDITALPFAYQTEELVQVAVTDGFAKLANTDEGYSVGLNWNAAHYPFCLLWMSNGGRDFAPWNNRHYALGIEPVASVFDLGIGHSCNPDTALAKHGPTSQRLTPSEPFRTAYSISVSPS